MEGKSHEAFLKELRLFLWCLCEAEGAWELPPDPERRASEETDEEFVGPPCWLPPSRPAKVTLVPPPAADVVVPEGRVW